MAYAISHKLLRKRPFHWTLGRHTQSFARVSHLPHPSFENLLTEIPADITPTFRGLKRVLNWANVYATRYIHYSEKFPHLTAAGSASIILFTADIIAQRITKKLSKADSSSFVWDKRRSMNLATFGLIYYGYPCKYLYFLYERFLGGSRFVLKTFIDCFIHTPFLLIPSYYTITGTLNGLTISESIGKLQKEWLSASFGSALYWTPIQLICFKYIPVHSRVVYICFCSLIHKTWLSWFSN